jgi:hypothetical protein
MVMPSPLLATLLPLVSFRRAVPFSPSSLASLVLLCDLTVETDTCVLICSLRWVHRILWLPGESFPGPLAGSFLLFVDDLAADMMRDFVSLLVQMAHHSRSPRGVQL